MFAKYVLSYLKAHAAAIITAGYLLDADLQSVHYHIGDVSPNKWYVVATAFAVAFGVVATLNNAPAAPADALAVPVEVPAPADDLLA